MVSDELLNQFKRKMRINYDIDDDNLREILTRSLTAIKANCGDFDVESDEYGRFLVLEHARYTFNDDVEFFMGNFAQDLNSYAFELQKRGAEDGTTEG